MHLDIPAHYHPLTYLQTVSSNVDEEFEKLILSVLNELEKVGKGDLLQNFFSQVSCGKFPLNNIAFHSWSNKFPTGKVF